MRGFNHHKISNEVIVFRKTENKNNVFNRKSSGTYEGVKFHYLFNSPIKSNLFIIRRIDNLLGILRLFTLSLTRMNSSTLIIYYSSYNLPAIVLKISKVFNRYIFFKEESEHPSVYQNKLCILNKFFFTWLHYRLFDGYILMTKSLMNYFKNQYPTKLRIHIPMTVDLERFRDITVTQKKYITYLGLINDKKDGIDILIYAYAKVIKVFADYKLILYGEIENKEIELQYNNIISDLGLEKNIVLCGKIDRRIVPAAIKESSLLILPRPKSIQAENGFPTKLGEYLASGNPVVVTAVGDIPLYLKDGKNAFIANPDDINSLADKISEALGNEVLSKKVGLNGLKTAEEHFSNLQQTKIIIEYFKQRFQICVE